MAENRKPVRSQRSKKQTGKRSAQRKPEKELLSFVPEKHRSLTWCLLLLLSLVIFFAGPIFNDEYFNSNDNISAESYLTYLNDMSTQGESPQWIPYIFSGMPGVASYMVTGDRNWDLTMKALYFAQDVFNFLNHDVIRVLFAYFILGLGLFFLLRWKELSRPISFFSAFAVMFSTWIIVWIMIGHNTKPMVLAFLPWIILFADRLIDRWSYLYAGLLILVVHYLVASAHPQTAFYGACLISIWLLTELIASIVQKNGKTAGIIRAVMVGLAAGIFAIGMGWDRFAVTLEYNEYSTRGADPILEETRQDPYQYATSWSYDVDETFTYLVPGYFGFGKLELDIPGIPPQPLPTYWGNEKTPFTDAGHYIGILVLILGLYGFWRYRSNPFVLGMGLAGIFGLLISYGANMPLLYDLLYNLVPKFNQFRAPSQSLAIFEFAFGLLSGFGLSGLLKKRSESGNSNGTAKPFLYGAIGSGIFFLLLFAIKSSYISALSSDSGLKRVFGGQVPPQVAEGIYGVMQLDWILSALFAGVFFLLAWSYLRGKVSGTVLVTLTILMSIVDLWHVGYRPMLENTPREQAFSVFQTTQADQFLIQQQDSGLFRIVDLTRHPSYPAHFRHQHIGGYSATKVRRYQDLMDFTNDGSTGMPGPGLAWDLLNTRYVISTQPAEPTNREVLQSPTGNVYERPTALPRAWFVDRVEVAEDRKVLEMIRDNGFNPREIAFVAGPLDVEIEALPSDAPTSSDKDEETPTDTMRTPAPVDNTEQDNHVKVTKWDAHEMEMEVDAPGTNFLVVSEVFYPVGWHATIDGESVETIRANYLLRGLVVPPGKHTIRYEYRSEGHETGVILSLALNILTLGLIGFGVYVERKPRNGASADETPGDDVDS